MPVWFPRTKLHIFIISDHKVPICGNIESRRMRHILGAARSVSRANRCYKTVVSLTCSYRLLVLSRLCRGCDVDDSPWRTNTKILRWQAI